MAVAFWVPKPLLQRAVLVRVGDLGRDEELLIGITYVSLSSLVWQNVYRNKAT